MGSLAAINIGTGCNIQMSRMPVLHKDLWSFKFLTTKHVGLGDFFRVQIAIHFLETYHRFSKINAIIRRPKITRSFAVMGG